MTWVCHCLTERWIVPYVHQMSRSLLQRCMWVSPILGGKQPKPFMWVIRGIKKKNHIPGTMAMDEMGTLLTRNSSFLLRQPSVQCCWLPSSWGKSCIGAWVCTRWNRVHNFISIISAFDIHPAVRRNLNGLKMKIEWCAALAWEDPYVSLTKDKGDLAPFIPSYFWIILHPFFQQLSHILWMFLAVLYDFFVFCISHLHLLKY